VDSANRAAAASRMTSPCQGKVGRDCLYCRRWRLAGGTSGVAASTLEPGQRRPMPASPEVQPMQRTPWHKREGKPAGSRTTRAIPPGHANARAIPQGHGQRTSKPAGPGDIRSARPRVRVTVGGQAHRGAGLPQAHPWRPQRHHRRMVAVPAIAPIPRRRRQARR
jgi:hypothetical protein